jgi:hypothetical protein
MWAGVDIPVLAVSYCQVILWYLIPKLSKITGISGTFLHCNTGIQYRSFSDYLLVRLSKYEQNYVYKDRAVLRIRDPGSFYPKDPGSGMNFFRIPDPGSRIPDPKHD